MIQISHKDHVGNAIAWLLLGVVGGLFLDLCAKEILRTYSLLQFVLVRSLIALAILLAIAPRVGGLRSLHTDKKAWHLLRTVLGMGAMFGFFYGLSVMPLINALTLGYTATSVSARRSKLRRIPETKKAGKCPPLVNIIGQRVFQLTSPA